MVKKFLIPVAAATAALMANAEASLAPQSSESGLSASSVISNQLTDKTGLDGTILQKMIYQSGDEEHALFMKRGESGMVFAEHYSHSSHASHASHRSGY